MTHPRSGPTRRTCRPWQRPSATDHWSIADNSRRCRFPRVLPQKTEILSIAQFQERAWCRVTPERTGHSLRLRSHAGEKRPSRTSACRTANAVSRALFCRRSGWDFSTRALDLPQLGQDTRHGDVSGHSKCVPVPRRFSPPVFFRRTVAAIARSAEGTPRRRDVFRFHRHPVFLWTILILPTAIEPA